MSALPHVSDIDLLGYCERVINLDAKIADCALDLRVTEQELNRLSFWDLFDSGEADDAIGEWRSETSVAIFELGCATPGRICIPMPLDGLTLFGLLVVTAIFYAGACGLASAYGFLQVAWPFGVIEAFGLWLRLDEGPLNATDNVRFGSSGEVSERIRHVRFAL